MSPAKSALLLLVCALACQAQGARADGPASHRPDLTGKWAMDAARSSFGGYKGPFAKAKTKVEIRHNDRALRAIWYFEYDGEAVAQLWDGFTDGRGEMNTSLLPAEEVLASPVHIRMGSGPGGPKVKSETKWDGDKLVTHTSDRLELPGGAVVEVEIVDEWELSADGKSLTQTTRVTPKRTDAGGAPAARASRAFKRVYGRAD